ncbi:MAG: DUF2905 family protein [Candidatus Daviesbacteria bacterium]|nr:DUF2905 family protein [Candidatus Daviesbacteria bacterium]
MDLVKSLYTLVLIFLLLGLMFNISPNFPKIPGDFYIDRGGFKIYIPWLSSIIISILLTILLILFNK